MDAANAGRAGAPAADAALCKAGTLDPAKVTGKVVLCLRGDNARIDKSLQVKNAGGVGMILYNADRRAGPRTRTRTGSRPRT